MLAQPPIEIAVPLAPPPGAIVLPVPYFSQCLSQWCWAACASMVLNFYKQKIDQCSVAGFECGGRDCCPCNPFCDRPCDPPDVATIYGNWYVSAGMRQGQVSPQFLLSELQAGRPIEVALGPCPGAGSTDSGHLVIVYGAASDTMFWVHDPLAEGSGPVDYAALVNGMGRGCWRWTWTAIQPQVAALKEGELGGNA